MKYIGGKNNIYTYIYRNDILDKKEEVVSTCVTPQGRDKTLEIGLSWGEDICEDTVCALRHVITAGSPTRTPRTPHGGDKGQGKEGYPGEMIVCIYGACLKACYYCRQPDANTAKSTRGG
jgi:hypothetical protein